MLRTTKFIAVAIYALTLFVPATATGASDRSIRCGTYILLGGGGKESASMYEVLKKCGEPEQKSGNNWIYLQGNMIRSLTFNYEGRLTIIESRRK